MYHNILVALDHTAADRALVPHITQLAKLLGSRLLLVHVADGWAARNLDQLNLVESEEMRDDRAYLERIAEDLRRSNLEVATHLACGHPPTEILKVADAEQCDLIAMTTHGHRLLGDIILGSTIEAVRHSTTIPMLVVRAQK